MLAKKTTEKASSIQIDSKYKSILENLKSQIRSTQLKAAVSVNRELIQLYWHIGKQISDKQANTRWGSKFVEAISRDLQNAFPETYGFSKRNLERMRQFAEFYPNLEIAAQPVSQLPWGHICLLNQKVKDCAIRDWYAKQTKAIPENLKTSLPTIEEIETELNNE